MTDRNVGADGCPPIHGDDNSMGSISHFILHFIAMVRADHRADALMADGLAPTKRWSLGSRPPLHFSLICLLSLSLSLPALAINKNAGTKNGDFLNLATDARGVALGDAGVSIPEGVESMRWNPAGLSNVTMKEVAGTHVEYYQGVQVENVGFAYPLGGEDGALALNAFYLSAGELDGRDSFGRQTGDFKFYDASATLGYGRKILTHNEGLDLSIGANVKIVQEKIADQSYQNPAFDLGFLGAPTEKLQFGLTARNIASSKANFAREIVGGVSYAFFNKTFYPALAVNYSNNAPIRFSFSGEYKIQELDGAAIRAGYKTHDSLDDSEDSKIPVLRKAGLAGLTMGAGFNYRIPVLQTLSLGLDYAMAPFGALGISHTITVKARW